MPGCNPDRPPPPLVTGFWGNLKWIGPFCFHSFLWFFSSLSNYFYLGLLYFYFYENFGVRDNLIYRINDVVNDMYNVHPCPKYLTFSVFFNDLDILHVMKIFRNILTFFLKWFWYFTCLENSPNYVSEYVLICFFHCVQ